MQLIATELLIKFLVKTLDVEWFTFFRNATIEHLLEVLPKDREDPEG